jgi:uncharacterized protein YhaN
MRFQSLHFKSFEPFADLALDLSGGVCGLHLVYGPNEAGKSSALRGLEYLLFGYPSKRCEDFRFPANEHVLAARLRNRAGQELAFARRRRRNPLTTLDGQTSLAEEQVQAFVGGLTKDQFRMLFGLDHQQQVEGGQEIVAGQGASARRCSPPGLRSAWSFSSWGSRA